MQYQVYTPGTLIEYTDGVDTYRDGERGGSYVIDVELTVLGFAGVENTDWANVETISIGGLATFRDGIRSGSYVLDETLTGTGFAGVEDIDWTNIYSLI